METYYFIAIAILAVVSISLIATLVILSSRNRQLKENIHSLTAKSLEEQAAAQAESAALKAAVEAERKQREAAQLEAIKHSTELEATLAQNSSQQRQLSALQEEILGERKQREQEQQQRAKLEAELEAERKAIADKVLSQEKFQQTLKEQFRTLAGDVLGEQSRHFKEQNRESMDIILKPFRDNIQEFRNRVDSIFTQQTEQSGELKGELRRLMELNQRITTETTNLTNALRGNSKTQGDWGEMILESILDNSNLIKGIHYQTQYNIKGEKGNDLRPDVVLFLPNNKQVIIDSKVSLTAYVNYVGAEDEGERKAALTAHLTSLRNHLKELGSKSYHRLMNSPDFVIMFIPNEPAFLDALKADKTLWNDAYDKKVIISSPTNLFALLKLVDDLWRRDDQNKNQEKILKYGLVIYEQVVAFCDELKQVGEGMDNAKKLYNNAFKRLYTGNNNIVRVGERMRNLGLATTKKISDEIVESSKEEENLQLATSKTQEKDNEA